MQHHMNKTFEIMGGDLRQLYLGEELLKNSYKINISYFDKKIIQNHLTSYNIKQKNITNDNEYIILPIPISKDGTTLNTPLCKDKIILNDHVFKKLHNKIVFYGGLGKLADLPNSCRPLKWIDYTKKEEFAILNAVPTAEASIQIASEQYYKTINKSNCLVLGFGKIGKILSKRLKDYGANVTVSARKNVDLTWIDALGYNQINTNSIDNILSKIDIIFNTIPHLILNEKRISNINKKSLIIDLASMPGGTDFEYAKQLGIKVIHALALPGKFSPFTSGQIIKKVILHTISEENL